MKIKARDSTNPATPSASLKLALMGLMICVVVYLLASRLITVASLIWASTFAQAPSPIASGSAAITADGSTVFVVNPDSGAVSAVDTRTDEKIGEVFVGDNPRSLSLSPDGQRLYVTSQGSSTLTILDACASDVPGHNQSWR